MKLSRTLSRLPWLLAVLGMGYTFLYLPIIILVIYSFNDNRLVTVWSGFSTRWYRALLDNEPLLQAAWFSLKVASLSATLAVILGTLAAVALVRYRRYRGWNSLGIMVSAPLVMPEVITGLSLLLLFVTLEQLTGWPAGRGQSTIVLAHATVAMAYVAVVVQSRLLGLDRSLEEAALDLGAHPGQVFWAITLPLIAPALVAGWLLAFTLSLDDLVVASFVSGPGGSTLPMVVYSSVRLGISPQINALATLMIGVVMVAVVITGALLYTQSRRQQR